MSLCVHGRYRTIVSACALLVMAGCHREGSSEPDAATASPVTPSAPAAPSASAPVAQAPPRPNMDVIDKEHVAKLLEAYFGGYGEDSSFEFYRDYYVPIVERFITLRQVSVAKMSAAAREFYRGKKNVAYTPDLKTLTLRKRNEQTVVEVDLNMSWTYDAPEKWTEVYGGFDGRFVEHSLTARIELALDPQGKVHLVRGEGDPPAALEGHQSRAARCVYGARRIHRGRAP
ncbi:hypothetical protein LVJ94_04170 [Pendulispora rubella]|uniref:Uncharacterized protein n=1 Tax=Pendulispora rubella TaxID=2741070 RepID=A0ABZ2L6P2_9BACT